MVSRRALGIAAVVVGVLGLLAMFFFPEPETNFLAYAGTALGFAIVVTILLIIHGRMAS